MKPVKITKQITNRSDDSLKKYLQDVAKIPQIGEKDENETELDLARRARNGDENALRKMNRAIRREGLQNFFKSLENG